MLFQDIQKQLKEDDWKKVNQRLMAKMLAEYMYEDMIHPTEERTNAYRLEAKEGTVYTFRAEPRLFDSFDVDVRSIRLITEDGEKEADSAVDLLIDLQETIGMSPETTGHLIKELNATLIADVHLLNKRTLPPGSCWILIMPSSKAT